MTIDTTNTFERVTATDLAELAAENGDQLISIYAPMYRAGKQVTQNSIRWKNVTKNVREQLKKRNVEKKEIDTLLGPLEQLIDDDHFWQHQSDGLAVFIKGDQSRCFKVPAQFDELVVVHQTYYLTPLLPAISTENMYYILAVSANRVRLLKVSGEDVTDLAPSELPKNLRDALNIDEYVETLQFHTATTQQRGGGKSDVVHHGQGGSNLSRKKQDEILQFFHKLSDSLREYFGTDNAPLIFAGVEYLFPIFKDASNLRHVLSEPIGGNPDELSPKQLKEKAMPIIANVENDLVDQSIERYASRANSDWVSDHIPEIYNSAQHGQVDTLLIEKGFQFAVEKDNPAVHANGSAVDYVQTIDLVNQTMVETLRAGGQVVAIEPGKLPFDAHMAATFRVPTYST
jgi:hypothetical protein